VRELHGAYVGVVEVLAQYLQGGNPRVKTRSARVAELSQLVAEALGLSQKQVDDVRVAALLHELGNLEVTTQVVSRAFDRLDAGAARHTFLGTELVQSLSSVLESALPLLADQDDAVRECLGEHSAGPADSPRGARIIRLVRAFDDLLSAGVGPLAQRQAAALARLRAELRDEADDEPLAALERVVQHGTRFVLEQPVPVA
jgi:response regulator RpfG family c-di-GMP phosphodiesterase